MEEFSDVQFKQRTVIEFLITEKVPPNEIRRRMQAVYVDQCVDVSTVRCWVRWFKDGELGEADLSDKTQSGRPVTASDQLHQDRAEELIRRNRPIISYHLFSFCKSVQDYIIHMDMEIVIFVGIKG